MKLKTITILTAEFNDREVLILSKCLKYIKHRYMYHEESGITKTLSQDEFERVEEFLKKLP